jgi:hypothetical protein
MQPCLGKPRSYGNLSTGKWREKATLNMRPALPQGMGTWPSFAGQTSWGSLGTRARRDLLLREVGRLSTIWGAVLPEGLEACAHLQMSQTHLA